MPSTASEAAGGAEPTYRFGFSWAGPYGKAVNLVNAHAPAGMVVDLGCGYGAVGEVLREAGRHYVGADVDGAALADLARRSLEAHPLDLTDTAGWRPRLVDLLDRRRVAAVLLLDVVEHLPDPGALLGEVAALCRDVAVDGVAPLVVVSIPHVAHIDLAAKLVGGRWDVTGSGLLDRTHLQLFTERRVDAELTRHGFTECGRDDVLLAHSDQWFPPDHPYLIEGGPAHDHLVALRRLADANGTVNQFVRAFRLRADLPAASGETGSPPPPAAAAVSAAAPSAAAAAAPVASGSASLAGAPASLAGAPASPAAAAEADAPALSVLTRTQGDRAEQLTEALTCLAAQTVQDLQVIVLVHSDDPGAVDATRAVVDRFAAVFAERVQVVPVGGGGRATPLNAGLQLAAGRLVAFLDDDDLVTADWAERFVAGAAAAPGKVVRSVCYARHLRRAGPEEAALGRLPVTLSRPRPEFSDTFDTLVHLRTNTTPILSFALPRVLLDELHLRFDERFVVCEDWDLLLRAALVVGVHDTGAVTCIYQRWDDAGTSTNASPPEVWAAAHAQLLAGLDAAPLLLPPDSASKLAYLVGEPGAWAPQVHGLQAELAEATRTIDQLRHERDATRNHAHQLQLRLDAAERERDAVIGSEFWKASAPLRRAVDWTRRRS